MRKHPLQGTLDIIEEMSTEDIEAKMKALVPGFDLGEFAVKAKRYISFEDLCLKTVWYNIHGDLSKKWKP